MKMLKKLALVSAVSMISAGAFAMEAMDEETMSATTGQDGITISIAPATKVTANLAAANLNVSAATQTAIDLNTGVGNATTGTTGTFRGLSVSQVVIHDDDGLENDPILGGTATTANSGALVIGDGNAPDSTVVLIDDDESIEIKLDMVGNIAGGVGNAPMLNVAIKTPKLAIKLGDIYVANSNASEVNFNEHGAIDTSTENDGTAAIGAVKILRGFEVVLGNTTTVIQLGNEAQGSMIGVNATIQGGLTINNFELFDANSGGSVQASSLVLNDAGVGTNLTAKVGIDATSAGLAITITELGTLAGGADLSLNNLAIGATGTTNVIGDVQILGLNLAGTVMTISGH